MSVINALVTGGAGFIGSHIVDRLLKDGYNVTVVDNESTDSHEQFYWNDKAHNFKYDINFYSRDKAGLRHLMEGMDYVFHLAAESRIQPAIENPLLAVKTNVLGTCNVLQAARECGVKRVVYSSTSSAYGFNSIPSKETMVKECLNPYSVSKTAGEELCQMYYKLFGVETVTFRYFNVYGERQPTKGQYAPVIGLFQKQHKEGKPMTVVGRGFQRRDFTHISDVVEANMKAAFSDNDKILGELFNIGAGINYNIHDLVRMVSGNKSPQDDIDFTYIPERPGEVEHSLSDCSKAHELLEWEPQVSLGKWIESCKQSV